MARLCAGNTRAVFACSVAFAGPLNDLLQGEGGGFNFVGSSSLGKTTLLILAGSVFGGGGRMGFVQSWHGTENGIESIARAHSGPFWRWMRWAGDGDGRTIGNMIYMLINGTGRCARDPQCGAQEPAELAHHVLSSSEISLANKIAEGGRQPRAGQQARMVDVPADAGKGYGAFEDTKGMEPAAFSEELKDACLAHATARQARLLSRASPRIRQRSRRGHAFGSGTSRAGSSPAYHRRTDRPSRRGPFRAGDRRR